MIKKIRYLYWLLICLPGAAGAQAVSLTIDDCYKMAEQHYPVIRKLDLVARSSRYSLANASKTYLPQLNITGQATYQSETIDFKDVLGNNLPPGINFPTLSKDQYKIQGEVTQAIYDGGNVGYQRASVRASQSVQQQQAEVTLYAVKDRVNQIYFSILLMEEQYKQNELRRTDLQNAADKTAAALKYGTAFRSSLDELKAELINADMSSTELRNNRIAYLQMLGVLIGEELDNNVHLEMPAHIELQPELNRPEIKLYDLQKMQVKAEEKRLRADYMPKLNGFFQGAYGRPTLNIIDNGFGSWYIFGARLNWNLGSLYTLGNNRKNLRINQESIDADRETFILNTNISLKQAEGDINKYRELLSEDEKAVELRTSVKTAAAAQLENGVITTHDYINQLNAEDQARQLRLLHKIQLLQATYKYNNTSGNQ
ncbi:TolC family protein [Chitinophagaceae bacterium MMS25-I14]